jgi:hypothetical protein
MTCLCLKDFVWSLYDVGSKVMTNNVFFMFVLTLTLTFELCQWYRWTMYGSYSATITCNLGMIEVHTELVHKLYLRRVVDVMPKRDCRLRPGCLHPCQHNNRTPCAWNNKYIVSTFTESKENVWSTIKLFQKVQQHSRQCFFVSSYNKTENIIKAFTGSLCSSPHHYAIDLLSSIKHGADCIHIF